MRLSDCCFRRFASVAGAFLVYQDPNGRKEQNRSTCEVLSLLAKISAHFLLARPSAPPDSGKETSGFAQLRRSEGCFQAKLAWQDRTRHCNSSAPSCGESEPAATSCGSCHYFLCWTRWPTAAAAEACAPTCPPRDLQAAPSSGWYEAKWWPTVVLKPNASGFQGSLPWAIGKAGQGNWIREGLLAGC